jgi:predicted AlkP superfamily phosphohydrolase/phosphomutase
VKDRDQGGTVAYADLEALKNELKEKLAAITFTSGKRVFELVEPEPREAEAGADAVIRVLKGSPTMDLLVGGATVQGLIDEIQMNTGEHETSAPPGFFLAWGPDIDKGFAAEAVRVQDVAPTLAFGLGLPVADDAAGQPITALFNRSFQKDNGKKSVASWGVHGGGAAVAGGAGAPGSTP